MLKAECSTFLLPGIYNTAWDEVFTRDGSLE